jgi:hypothetical protein
MKKRGEITPYFIEKKENFLLLKKYIMKQV